MNNALDLMCKNLEQQGTPKDYVGKIRGQLAQMLTNEEKYPQTILKDISLYYHSYGKNFESNIIEYDTQLPNPLSGSPIPAKGRYHFKRSSSGNSVIEWEQQIDPDSAAKFVKEFVKQLDSTADLTTLPSFDLHDRAKYQFDKTNAIILMEHERKVETLDRRNFNKKIIRRL